MKTLFLMRHAKAADGTSGMTDHERPLAPRGERDAPLMGTEIRRQGTLPDTVLSSDALRTRQTAEAVVAASGTTASPQFLSSLYGAEVSDVLTVLEDLPDKCRSVLIVGHNPTVTHLLHKLTDSRETMQTATVACIGINIELWEEIENSRGTVQWLISPADIRAAK